MLLAGYIFDTADELELAHSEDDTMSGFLILVVIGFVVVFFSQTIKIFIKILRQLHPSNKKSATRARKGSRNKKPQKEPSAVGSGAAAEAVGSDEAEKPPSVKEDAVSADGGEDDDSDDDSEEEDDASKDGSEPGGKSDPVAPGSGISMRDILFVGWSELP